MLWDGLDRRKFPRVIYPCLVKVTSNNVAQEAMLTHTENIGIGGICAIVKKEIKLFTPVDLEIDILDVDEHIRAKGKVVWSVRRKAIEDMKPLFYDIGIEFSEISKRDQGRLRENIEQLIKRGTKLLKPFI